MSESLAIRSHKGVYTARFCRSGLETLKDQFQEGAHYIVDGNVARLHRERLENVLAHKNTLIIEATEENKSLDRFPDYVEKLVRQKIRRQQPLVAVGGGIIQDITCFLATTMMRGLPWFFYPTTLLAQADSCIGSKSSINSGDIKNILGTFNPPGEIVIDTGFLSTLEVKHIQSGIGEMIKVHAINGPESFDDIAANYHRILEADTVLEAYIYKSLEMKKRLIEIDEFDQGPRNVMNYGHSFGHAIESATCFAIPHGIAVTIGMDMANYIAAELGISNRSQYQRMHPLLQENYAGYAGYSIPFDKFLNALSKDKKNTASQLKLILPGQDGVIDIVLCDNDETFQAACVGYFKSGGWHV